MKNFVIISNCGKDIDGNCAEEVIRTLERHGLRCTACLTAVEAAERGEDFLYTDPALVPAETEAVISLGGDGTFIHATKDLISLNLPVFGVNFGTLGYLTEVDSAGFDEALSSIVAGDFEIEERMLLKYEIVSAGETARTGLALNDIVIHRAVDTGIGQFDVVANGQFLNRYSADGMIVSTPTGSTGYNLSAGGPVVMPTAGIVLVTPICAHTLNSRSIVFPADDGTIEIISEEGSPDKPQNVFATVDGERSIPLSNGDSVVAYKASKSAKIIKTDKMSFVVNLGKKMRY